MTFLTGELYYNPWIFVQVLNSFRCFRFGLKADCEGLPPTDGGAAGEGPRAVHDASADVLAPWHSLNSDLLHDYTVTVHSCGLVAKYELKTNTKYYFTPNSGL